MILDTSIQISATSDGCTARVPRLACPTVPSHCWASQQRLCCLSKVFLSEAWGFPWFVVFEECVEDDEQFAHAGGDDDLEGLSGLFESVGEFFDDGVVAFGGECGHVEGATDGGPSSPGGAFSLESSAVSVGGGESDEGSDFLPVELSEFGQFGEQDGGGASGDPRDALHEVVFGLPLGVALDALEELVFEFFDLLVELVEEFSDTLSYDFRVGGLESVLFGGPMFDELASPRDDFLEDRLYFGGF